MEYIRVKVNDREEEKIPVLVNGEENGFTCDVMQLEEGFVEISVKLKGAETKEIELVDTTADHPKEVLIHVA